MRVRQPQTFNTSLVLLGKKNQTPQPLFLCFFSSRHLRMCNLILKCCQQGTAPCYSFYLLTYMCFGFSHHFEMPPGTILNSLLSVQSNRTVNLSILELHILVAPNNRWGYCPSDCIWGEKTVWSNSLEVPIG